MIRIIGTAHARTQLWSDAIQRCQSLDACAATGFAISALIWSGESWAKALVVANISVVNVIMIRFISNDPFETKV
jgi:hypothetical protein